MRKAIAVILLTLTACGVDNQEPPSYEIVLDKLDNPITYTLVKSEDCEGDNRQYSVVCNASPIVAKEGYIRRTDND